MTHPDGRAYTLDELEKIKAEGEDLSAIENVWSEQDRDSQLDSMRPVERALSLLQQEVDALANVTRELFEHIGPVLADKAAEPAEPVKALVHPGASKLIKSIAIVRAQVRDLDADVAHVLDRVEL